MREDGTLFRRRRQLLMAVQGLEELREERGQAFRAQKVAGDPQLLEKRAERGIILPGSAGPASTARGAVPQDLDRDLAMAARDPAELIEQAAFVPARGEMIARTKGCGVLADGEGTHVASWPPVRRILRHHFAAR